MILSSGLYNVYLCAMEMLFNRYELSSFLTGLSSWVDICSEEPIVFFDRITLFSDSYYYRFNKRWDVSFRLLYGKIHAAYRYKDKYSRNFIMGVTNLKREEMEYLVSSLEEYMKHCDDEPTELDDGNIIAPFKYRAKFSDGSNITVIKKGNDTFRFNVISSD